MFGYKKRFLPIKIIANFFFIFTLCTFGATTGNNHQNGNRNISQIKQKWLQPPHHFSRQQHRSHSAALNSCNISMRRKRQQGDGTPPIHEQQQHPPPFPSYRIPPAGSESFGAADLAKTADQNVVHAAKNGPENGQRLSVRKNVFFAKKASKKPSHTSHKLLPQHHTQHRRMKRKNVDDADDSNELTAKRVKPNEKSEFCFVFIFRSYKQILSGICITNCRNSIKLG